MIRKDLQLKKIEKQVLGEEFFNAYNEPAFDMSTFLNTSVFDENDFMQPKYNNQDKAYLRGLKIALDKSIERTTSDPDALRNLIDLEENDPYLVKQKAIELSRDGLLSTSDFKHYYDSANLQQIYKTNKFFRLSDPFNTCEECLKIKIYQQYQVLVLI